MVRYVYAWMPLVIIAAVFVLAMPWLGLIALMISAIVALAALAALAWAAVSVPYMLSRAITRRLHIRSGATPRSASSLSPAGYRHRNKTAWRGAPSLPHP